jgi:ABC-type transport system involved in multi-copper enzyme maturation permease subunit
MVVLYGAAAISIGLFFSSLFANPILSFVATVSSLLVLDTIQFLPQTLVLSKTAALITTRLSFAWHLDSALRGILDTRDIFFYVLPCIGLLYGTAIIIRNRRA